ANRFGAAHAEALHGRPGTAANPPNCARRNCASSAAGYGFGMSVVMAKPICQPLKLKRHGYPGVLITFCGVDGSGKSSLIAGLEKLCSESGLRSLTTYTPTRRIRADSVFRELVGDPCNT